jgi:hypothetical protein
MPHDLKLFVVDTGPLITLAVAQSLDYLLYVDADIVIPDRADDTEPTELLRLTKDDPHLV